MSFDDQTEKKQLLIIQKSVKFREVALGVFIQTVRVSELKKLLDSKDKDDSVAMALQDADNIFRDCQSKNVDMFKSMEGLVDDFDKDQQKARNRKKSGKSPVKSKSKHACVLLAWNVAYDQSSRNSVPSLVGVAVLSEFNSKSNFSTLKDTLSEKDFLTLKPKFKSNWLYIDTLCSTMTGVGKLLVISSYNIALRKNMRGVIALSYSSKASVVPESYKVFKSLNFDVLIEKASFDVRMYGTWFAKSDDDADIKSVAAACLNVCTRKGYTSKTSDKLMWRC